MPEIVRGFVPRVAVSPRHGFGTKNHAMLITDTRTFLIPWKTGRAILGQLLDWGVVADSGVLDSERALTPETWLSQPQILAIPHEVVAKLQCRRALNTYFFLFKFGLGGKQQTVSGFLFPSRAYIRRRKKEGLRASACAREYAKMTGDLLLQVPSLGRVLDWRI